MGKVYKNGEYKCGFLNNKYEQEDRDNRDKTTDLIFTKDIYISAYFNII
jgi:hypothetical protein